MVVNPDIEEEFTESGSIPEDSFEQRMLRRVNSDYEEAGQFLDTIHAMCRDNYAAYHNAPTYEDLRKKNRFPMPTMQVLVDQYVAHITDKLFYANKPCTVVGVEESDKPDADAKQDMIAWQDNQDGMFLKLELFVRDTALYPFCVAQTDYIEKTKTRWVVQDTPTMMDGMGNVLVSEERWVRTDMPAYRGPTTKRIDPTDFFFGRDKRSLDDEFPIMVRSKQTKAFFDDKSYFFNQGNIKTSAAQTGDSDIPAEKRELMGLQTSAAVGTANYEYIEWQAPVNARDLCEFIIQTDPERAEEYTSRLEQTEENEKRWAICGVVDGNTVVRLDFNPLDLDRSNINLGYAIPEENELIGNCLGTNVMPVHKGQEVLMGILLENFKQSVDRQWIINKTAIVGQKPLVNKPGNVLLTNQDINNVAKVIDQPPISQDIYRISEGLARLGESSSGVPKQIQGRKEPGVETLGEANILQSQAELGLRKSLKTFEVTFVEPLYTLRNDINCNFIDTNYAFYVIGESAVNWREVSPGEIRSPVDFICESSTREANRAVIGQQMLQLADMAPAAIAAGQMVRIDKIMQMIAENVFSMKKATIYELFPLIQFEDAQKTQGGPGINDMLAQNALMRHQFETEGAAPQPPGTPGSNLPEPKSEQEAQASIQGRNQPQ